MARQFEPQVQAALDAISRIESGHQIFSVEGARAFYLALNPLAGPPEPVAQVKDCEIPGPGGMIPIRIYRPVEGVVLPATIFFHGGWFFLGGLETHDALARSLANASSSVVIAVDYRLAPENSFPAAPNDCYATLTWVVENAESLGVDPEKIAVAGDSVGGALAAVVARRAHERHGPKLVFQGLMYPLTDSSFSTGSWQAFGDGPLIQRSQAVLARLMYTPNKADWQNPDAFPLFAADLHGLPPALVITAEIDPLRDEGEAYAEAMQRSGVPVVLSRYTGMIHGFVQMAGVIDAGHRAIEELATALGQAFEP